MPQCLSWYTILKALKNRARGSRTTQKFVQPGSYRVEILLGEGFGFVSNASDDRYLVVARAWLILTWLHAIPSVLPHQQIDPDNEEHLGYCCCHYYYYYYYHYYYYYYYYYCHRCRYH